MTTNLAEPLSMVARFNGAYECLSNFPLRPVSFEGATYPSKEHAFAAAKTLDPNQRQRIAQQPTPAKAKAAGRAVTLRPQWDETVRFQVMRELLEADFTVPGTDQHRSLMSTGDALLIEGTTWQDEVWGRCTCPAHATNAGLNHLGRELMALRGRLRGDVDRWHRVAVTGHRELSAADMSWVGDELPRVLAKLTAEHGTAVMINGMAVGADTLAGHAAISAGLSLWAYIPYPQQAVKFTAQDMRAWQLLRDRAQREVVLSPTPAVRHLHNRNRLMMLDADAMIAIVDPARTTGGTATTFARACTDGWPVIKLDLVSHRVTRLK